MKTQGRSVKPKIEQTIKLSSIYLSNIIIPIIYHFVQISECIPTYFRIPRSESKTNTAAPANGRDLGDESGCWHGRLRKALPIPWHPWQIQSQDSQGLELGACRRFGNLEGWRVGGFEHTQDASEANVNMGVIFPVHRNLPWCVAVPNRRPH